MEERLPCTVGAAGGVGGGRSLAYTNCKHLAGREPGRDIAAAGHHTDGHAFSHRRTDAASHLDARLDPNPDLKTDAGVNADPQSGSLSHGCLQLGLVEHDRDFL